MVVCNFIFGFLGGEFSFFFLVLVWGLRGVWVDTKGGFSWVVDCRELC